MHTILDAHNPGLGPVLDHALVHVREHVRHLAAEHGGEVLNQVLVRLPSLDLPGATIPSFGHFLPQESGVEFCTKYLQRWLCIPLSHFFW